MKIIGIRRFLGVRSTRRVSEVFDFYVDAAGGLDSNPGTEALPWQTLEKVESSATNGSSVGFKRGQTWTTKGTADANTMLYITQQNLTLGAYGVGALPVINGGGTVRNGIKFASGAVNNLTKFFRLYNCGGGGTGALWANDSLGLNSIEDCEIDTHTSDAGVTSGVGSSSIGRRLSISNCADDGLTCHGLNGVGSSFSIYNSIIFDNADGINHSVTNGGNIITICENVIFFSNTRDTGNLDVGTHTFNWCIFGKSGEAQSPTVMQISLPPEAVGSCAVVLNACLIDARESTVTAEPGFGTGNGAVSITLNQCTFFADETGPEGVGAGNLVCYQPIIMNNCIIRNWWRAAYVEDAGEFDATNCIVSGIEVGEGNISYVGRIGSNSTDPLFTDPDAGDFTLQGGSPAAGAGTTTSVVIDLAGQPFGSPPSVGCFEGVASSATLKDDEAGASEGSMSIGADTPQRYTATYVTAGSSYTLDNIRVWLEKFGSPTFNITVELRANSANSPGAVLQTSSTSIAAGSLTASEVEKTFAGFSQAMVNGTTYWIVVALDAVGDGSNYVKWHYVSGTYPGFTMTKRSSDGTTWNDFSNISPKYATYGTSV